MSDMVGNPVDRFSRFVAHLIQFMLNNFGHVRTVRYPNLAAPGQGSQRQIASI